MMLYCWMSHSQQSYIISTTHLTQHHIPEGRLDPSETMLWEHQILQSNTVITRYVEFPLWYNRDKSGRCQSCATLFCGPNKGLQDQLFH